MESTSVLVAEHLPCPCGDSSDAFATYSDGHGFCFGKCGGKYFNEAGVIVDNLEPVKKQVNKTWDKGEAYDLRSRNLTKETCEKYGILAKLKEGTKKIERILLQYPGSSSAQTGMVAQKVKRLSPDGDTYSWQGEQGRIGLFGQHLFPPGSAKYITLTEGEIDAASAYEMNGKFPAVSIPNGASAALSACKQHFKYLDSFDTIVVNFDNDEPGNKAAHQIANLFLGKVRILQLSQGKDANEYLKNDMGKDYRNEWWKAEVIKPDNVVSGSEVWTRLQEKKEVVSIPLPWDGLNALTFGCRISEMWTITSGSGMGKSQVLRELAYHFISNTDWNVGGLFLEETVDESALGLMSIHAQKPLHLPTTEYSEEEYKEAFDNTIGTDRVFFYDHFGSNEIENILGIVKFLARACDCKVIFLDHISILVSDQHNADERRALDEIATKLKTACMELGVLLIMVSHSKRPAGKPHEEGGQTSLSELRGTAGIGQLSNIVLGLERNGQAEDMVTRNTTTLRVLKNRFSGLTGPACQLTYDITTGRMTEMLPPDPAEELVSEDETKGVKDEKPIT